MNKIKISGLLKRTHLPLFIKAAAVFRYICMAYVSLYLLTSATLTRYVNKIYIK